MRQRGRKSVSATTAPLTVINERRLPPPADLTGAERSAWLAITSCRPGSWFDSASVPLLIALIRHEQSADVLATEIAHFDPQWLRDEDGLERYRSLLAMRERETRAMAALSRSLRLTPQSIHAVTAGRAVDQHRAAPASRPWDFSEGGFPPIDHGR